MTQSLWRHGIWVWVTGCLFIALAPFSANAKWPLPPKVKVFYLDVDGGAEDEDEEDDEEDEDDEEEGDGASADQGSGSRPDPKPVELDFPVKTSWVWKDSPAIPLKVPYVRTSILLPADLKIADTGSDEVKIFKEGKRQKLRVDLFDLRTEVEVKFKDKKATEKVILIFEMISRRPALLVHSDCTKKGLIMRQKGVSGSHIYVGVNCDSDDDHFYAYVIAPPGFRISDGAERFKLFRTPLSEKLSRKSKPLGNFDVRKDGKASPITYRMAWRQRQGKPKGSSIKLKFAAGFGPTIQSYREDPINIRISELGVTGHFYANVEILKDQLDATVGALGDLLIISQSNDAISGTRFYAFDLKAHYQLPIPSQEFRFKAGLGWYFWGMSVDNDAYGVSSLSGPQFLFRIEPNARDPIPYWGEIKIAPIADSFSNIGFGNRELAIGGGYVVTNALAEHPIAVIARLSDIRFEVSGATNDIRATALTVGAEVQF